MDVVTISSVTLFFAATTVSASITCASRGRQVGRVPGNTG